MDEPALREAIVAAARRLNSAGLSAAATGNISARCGESFLITPSGVAYDQLAPADIVRVSMDGQSAAGQLVPSTEWRFHRDIYRARAEFNAIVHAHSPHASALACARRGIPPFHYMVGKAGGRDIRCAEYATFGTQALSDNALAALAGRRACLLANHGLIAAGADLDEAFRLAWEVEDLARQYILVLQIGEPVLLDDAEMDRIVEKFRHYGEKRG
jgi:L-fuculose-phosphate aldolase